MCERERESVVSVCTPACLSVCLLASLCVCVHVSPCVVGFGIQAGIVDFGSLCVVDALVYSGSCQETVLLILSCGCV